MSRANIGFQLVNMIGGKDYVPKDGERGYAPGAIAVKLTGNVALGIYINRGTFESCEFWSMDGCSALIAGTSEQDINTRSATKSYQIGSRIFDPINGCAYRYSEAVGDCSTEMLAYSAHRLQALNYSAVVSGALGAKTMVVTVGGSDGDGSGNIAVDFLKGGHILITNDGTNGSVTLPIVGNTLGDSGAMTITLGRKLPHLLTASHKVEAMGSQYAQLTAAENCPADASFQGRPTRKGTSSYPFFWLQTWGPCWITPNNGFQTENVGNSVYNSQIVAWNGTIGTHQYDEIKTEYQQHIGYVLSRTQAGTTQGAPIIMLQIAP